MDKKVPKYIKIDGLLQKNPEPPDNRTTAPSKSLVPVCSVSDLAAQNDSTSNYTKIELAGSTATSIDIMQDEECTLSKYRNVADASVVIDGLSEIFNELEITIGMLSKLQELSTDEFFINMLIDDSSSMGTCDSVSVDSKTLCTRWAEVHSRLLSMFRLLAFVPIQKVIIQFINRPTVLEFTHADHTPESFINKVRNDLAAVFAVPPRGNTMLVEKLRGILKTAESRSSRTSVYLFCDGKPSDINGQGAIRDLLRARNARKIPFTFLSCTGNDEDVEWAKDLDEIVLDDGSPSFIAECDDYKAEKNEVEHDQGCGIPYTYGFYLICNLVAAINPSDLDALDESVPLTKGTLDNLMGRITDMREYEYYFKSLVNNPKKTRDENEQCARLWNSSYAEFCRTDIEAHRIEAVRQYYRTKITPPPYAP